MDEELIEITKYRDELASETVKIHRPRAHALIEVTKRRAWMAKLPAKAYIIAAGFLEWRSAIEEKRDFTFPIGPERLPVPEINARRNFRRGLRGLFEFYSYELTDDQGRWPLENDEAEATFALVFEAYLSTPARESSTA